METTSQLTPHFRQSLPTSPAATRVSTQRSQKKSLHRGQWKRAHALGCHRQWLGANPGERLTMSRAIGLVLSYAHPGPARDYNSFVALHPPLWQRTFRPPGARQNSSFPSLAWCKRPLQILPIILFSRFCDIRTLGVRDSQPFREGETPVEPQRRTAHRLGGFCHAPVPPHPKSRSLRQRCEMPYYPWHWANPAPARRQFSSVVEQRFCKPRHLSFSDTHSSLAAIG